MLVRVHFRRQGPCYAGRRRAMQLVDVSESRSARVPLPQRQPGSATVDIYQVCSFEVIHVARRERGLTFTTCGSRWPQEGAFAVLRLGQASCLVLKGLELAPETPILIAASHPAQWRARSRSGMMRFIETPSASVARKPKTRSAAAFQYRTVPESSQIRIASGESSRMRTGRS